MLLSEENGKSLPHLIRFAQISNSFPNWRVACIPDSKGAFVDDKPLLNVIFLISRTLCLDKVCLDRAVELEVNKPLMAVSLRRKSMR